MPGKTESKNKKEKFENELFGKNNLCMKNYRKTSGKIDAERIDLTLWYLKLGRAGSSQTGQMFIVGSARANCYKIRGHVRFNFW